MILNRITLRNVGVYGGEHTIDLRPPDPEHPVILIGALNGAGKTTLLGALQLALYGSRARGIERTRKGYQRYLKDLINRDAAPSEGASVTLEFDRWINGRQVRHTVRRSWSVENEQVLEYLTVQRGGEPDSLLTEHWDEAIDAYLPARLAHLFFFDGEQIERMADEEASRELLASAFQSLLGLDLVARLQEDLAVLTRRKKLSARSPAERSQIELLQKEALFAEGVVQDAKQKLASLAGTAKRWETELRKAKEDFLSQGGELALQRDAFESDRSRLASEIGQIEARIRELAGGPAPFLLIPELLEDLRVQADAEVAAGRERIIADAEAARDVAILQELKDVLPKTIYKTVAGVLQSNRPSRDHLQTPAILNGGEDLLSEMDELLKRTLPHARVELCQLSERWHALDAQVTALDKKLAAVPDADAIARLQTDITRLETEIKNSESKRRELDEEVRRAEFDLRLRQAALNKELDKHADHEDETEHERRLIQHIPKVRQTLDTFRAKVVARHINSLERSILESFLHLARKPKLIGQIKVNPSTFQIGLVDGDGKPLPFDLLSAGERQLLATSILWGLAKVSGRPVPLVIDTPLGRLDSHHRSHMVQRYFTAASHQVVLLSTDEEIVGRYHDMIAPHVGRKFLLTHEWESKRLQVLDSYFALS